MDLSFDIISAAWNKIKTGSAPILQQKVSGLINPQAIMIQRTAEDQDSFTVMFRGFDKALDDITRSPILKNIIVNWLQKFAIIQIERGSLESLIVKIEKTGKSPEKPSINNKQLESKDNKNKNEDTTFITRIVEVRETISKNKANYKTHPVDGKQCVDCVMFIPTNKCDLVEGKISPHGHCEYFEDKNG